MIQLRETNFYQSHIKLCLTTLLLFTISLNISAQLDFSVQENPGTIMDKKQEALITEKKVNTRSLLGYTAISDSAITDTVLVQTDYFDKAGLKLKTDRYWGYGKQQLKETTTFVYDEKKHLVEETNDGSVHNSAKTIYRYDIKGNCVSKKWLPADSSIYSETKNTFDDHANWITQEISSQSKSAYSKRTNKHYKTYKYDKNGKTLEETSEDNGNGRRKYQTFFSYDNQGNMIKEETIFFSGLGTRKMEYNYDKNNRLIEVKEFEQSKWYHKIQFSYYPSGLLKERCVSYNGDDEKTYSVIKYTF